MSLFDQKSLFFEAAKETLFNNLVERDAKAEFSLKTFTQFSELGLFKGALMDDPTRLEGLQKYYDISRASLDLPFTSSLAAHGFVGGLMLSRFATSPFKLQHKKSIEQGRSIIAISNSEHGTAIHLKKMKARLLQDSKGTQLDFQKPCITNGSVASLLLTTVWNENKLEIYVLQKNEVEQKSISSRLVGFRTGDTGSVTGLRAQSDLTERRLTSGTDTIEALRYCYFTERLIVAVMAAGVAHGLEDYLTNNSPTSLSDALGDNKQYMQEKVLRLRMARIQMTSLIESVVHRGAEGLMNSETELTVLKLMVSTQLREAVFGCIEIMGHRALFSDHVLPKVLRDIQMCAFFGGTQELQKINLFDSMAKNEIEEKFRPGKKYG